MCAFRRYTWFWRWACWIHWSDVNLLRCSAVALLPLLGWVLLGALAGAAVGAVVVTLIALVVCGSRCNTAASVSGVSNAADLIPVLTASPLDCDSATAAVDEIQAKLDAALDDYQSQQEVVSDRTATLNTRRNTFIAAMAALAATAFWDPFAMVAAAAAVAAAAVAVAMAASKLLAEQARLAELAALVASLQMALKTATEIKKGLCGDSSESPEEPEQPGIIDVPGINIGLLNG